MPGITETSLTSYATISQALISLGVFYYENHHDNPSPEVKSIIDAIDRSLLGMEATEPQANAECVENQSGDSKATASPFALQGDELAPTDNENGSMPVERKTSRQCPYCDAPLPDNAKFCGTCGSSLS